MKKVVVMGYIGLHNFGDNFITDSVHYLVNAHSECESCEVDFEPKMNLLKKFFYYGVLCLSKIIKKDSISGFLEYQAVKIRCARQYKKWFAGSNGVVFGAGSFKYGTQKLWAYYSLSIEIANKFGIPVMFDAMNIQQFNDSKYRCRFLRDHANYPNVKVITSRDGEFGVERLRRDYKIRKEIVCAGVGDAAFWIPECYGVSKIENSDVIGINVLYGSIFTKYGKSFSEENVLNLYVELMHKLDAINVKWELFTNGLSSDYDFCKKVIEKYGKSNVVLRHPNSALEALDIITSYKVIFASRLHACISAYSLDIPIVSFYWDDKMVFFSKMAGIEDSFFDESNLNSTVVYDKLMNYYNNGFEYDVNSRNHYKELTREYLYDFLSNC